MDNLKVIFKNKSKTDITVPNEFGITEEISTFRLQPGDKKEVMVSADNPIAIYEEICWVKKTDRNDRFYSDVKLKKRKGFKQELEEPVISIDLSFDWNSDLDANPSQNFSYYVFDEYHLMSMLNIPMKVSLQYFKLNTILAVYKKMILRKVVDERSHFEERGYKIKFEIGLMEPRRDRELESLGLHLSEHFRNFVLRPQRQREGLPAN